MKRMSELRRVTPLARGEKPLKRTAPKKRSGAISPATPAQRAAIEGRACIVCAGYPCSPSHLIDRSLAPAFGDDPRITVPLCDARCHREYDEGFLDLSPYLEPHWRESVAAAVEAVGLLAALRRITNKRWTPVEAEYEQGAAA